MARISVATQQPTAAGLALVLTAPTADGDVVDAGTVLLVQNTGESPTTVTVTATATVAGLPVGDAVVTVAAGATGAVSLASAAFSQKGNADSGRCYVGYSSVTGVVRAAVVAR